LIHDRNYNTGDERKQLGKRIDVEKNPVGKLQRKKKKLKMNDGGSSIGESKKSRMRSFVEIGLFDDKVIQWDIYEEKIENFFKANDISKDALKVTILLNKLHDEVYATI
jgi:hypothetical protein